MLLDFLAALKQGYTDPRASARAMLARTPSLQECGLMAVLALCMMALGEKFARFLFEGTAEAAGLPMLLAHLGLQFLQLFIMAVASHEIGAKFGGKATRMQMAALSAWHLVLQAALSPIQLSAILAASTGTATILVLLLPLSVGLLIWVYASFVAEAHGFKRIGPVLVATFVGFMLLGALAQIVLSAVLMAQGDMPPPMGAASPAAAAADYA